MKFSKLSQLSLVSATGLLVATLFTGCAITTVDYVFVATNSGIETYAADATSGALRTGAPTVSSGGTNPVALVVTSDYANLYVANAGGDSIVHFAIARNGVLTKKDSVILGDTPVSLAVNAASTYLYVVSGTSTATLTAFPLSSGAIGTAVATESLAANGKDTFVPTAVAVLANNDAVYATVWDQSAYNPNGTTTSTANPGWIFGFAVGTGGVLTSATGSPWEAGVKPTAITADPTNRFLYVTDFATNQLIGYSIQSTDTLNFLLSGTSATGSEPTAATIDPRGKFLYLTNALGNSVSAYAITLTTGAPTPVTNITGSATNSTDTNPAAVVVEPALGRFVYTANSLGNSISGFKLDPSSGSLQPTQSAPYPTGKNPVAIVSVPHGNHAVQSVTP